MRAIKFRAWDKQIEKMYPVKTIYWRTPDSFEVVLYDETHLWQENVVLMQFTGLYDKNGKEIYEGDIITYYFRTRNDNKKFTSPVFFDEYMWLTNEHSLNRANDVEVIGNIYENPNLLSS